MYRKCKYNALRQGHLSYFREENLPITNILADAASPYLQRAPWQLINSIQLFMFDFSFPCGVVVQLPCPLL